MKVYRCIKCDATVCVDENDIVNYCDCSIPVVIETLSCQNCEELQAENEKLRKALEKIAGIEATVRPHSSVSLGIAEQALKEKE